MIKVLLTKPYNESLTFLFDTIKIGSDYDSDIIIQSKKNIEAEVYLTMREEKIEINTNQKDLFFFHNGKKVLGNIKLKNQDVISFPFLEFKILDFKKEVKKTNEKEFEKNYQELSRKEKVKEKEIIETIEKNIFVIEKELNEDV